jgi:hypothetical protein
MLADNPYITCVDFFKNTKEFSYLAEQYNRTGMYTSAIPGTIEYLDFWQGVRDICVEGFTNSCGQKITGQHFFYLNFCPILGLNEKTGKKSKIFPRFIDLDYEFFHMIEYCRLNQKSLVAVKGRRQGWSYKAAAICTHEFYFYPDSKAVIGAFFSSFSQNTMNMVVDNSNFINTNTEFRKQRNPDLKDFIKARYQATVNGVKVWKGFNSEVRSISFKDNPTAAVGLSASWLILDEAGVFNNITDTYGYTEPLIKDGSTYTGVALVFGSSGDMDSGSKYFYEMFTNPDKYNMLSFEDPFNPNSKIGFFSSATKGRLGKCLNPNSKWYKQPMTDEDGNSNYEAAQDDIEFNRISKRNGLDPKAIHNETTQFPLNWKEAFLRNKGNVFGSPEMLEWLGHLENTPSLRGQAQKGELFFDKGEVKWRPNDELTYITDFPLRKDPKSGQSFTTDSCAVIWEHPEKQDNGEIPSYLYIAGCDPYDQDKSESGSLGSFFVYKRFYRADRTHDIIVAEYTSRPDTAEQFYENCRKLCMYYNAKVLYENQLKGLKVYFEQKNALQYMCEQPGIIRDMVKDSRVQRGYGIHMNRGTNGASGIKDQCELYLKKWLYEEVSGETEGTKVCRFQTIKSIPLLKELIAYDRDINTDRVIAVMLCVLQTYELHRIHVEELLDMKTTSGDFLEKIYQKNLIFNRRNSQSQFNPSRN